jgi:hypothetical protein
MAVRSFDSIGKTAQGFTTIFTERQRNLPSLHWPKKIAPGVQRPARVVAEAINNDGMADIKRGQALVNVIVIAIRTG